MNVHPDLSFLSLVVTASVVVQGILALLVLASLWSWWHIFLKLFQLKRAAREADLFEENFWKGGDLNEIYQRASQARIGSGLEHIFTAGFREFSKHRRQGSSSLITLDSARRAMRAAYQREVDMLDGHLAGLATVGSVSPYVGLFGTVWGIMNAFRGLANVSQATLAQVAQKINAANTGVSAYVVNSSDGARLVFKGQEGADNGFVVEASETAGDEGLVLQAHLLDVELHGAPPWGSSFSPGWARR